jgi:hypothetical protein
LCHDCCFKFQHHNASYSHLYNCEANNSLWWCDKWHFASSKSNISKTWLLTCKTFWDCINIGSMINTWIDFSFTLWVLWIPDLNEHFCLRLNYLQTGTASLQDTLIWHWRNMIRWTGMMYILRCMFLAWNFDNECGIKKYSPNMSNYVELHKMFIKEKTFLALQIWWQIHAIKNN